MKLNFITIAYFVICVVNSHLAYAQKNNKIKSFTKYSTDSLESISSKSLFDLKKTDRVNRFNEKGEKFGLWIIGETTPAEIYYKNDVADGIYKAFFQNGMLDCIGEYHNDLPIGSWLFFDELGFLVMKISEIKINTVKFKNSASILIKPKYYSLFKFYYKNGLISQQGHCFSNDINDFESIKEGKWKFYSEQGILQKEETFKIDKIIK